jgi:hypothetical protein
VGRDRARLPATGALTGADDDLTGAGGDGDVVDVKGDQLGRADPGVVENPHDRPIPIAGQAFGAAQHPAQVRLVEGTGCLHGQVDAVGTGRTETEMGVEGADGGEVCVDCGRRPLRHRER